VAFGNGAQAVFAPNRTDRAQLLDAAVSSMRGGDQAKLTPIGGKSSSAALPTFSIEN